jgi:hypothetical protein
LTDPSGPTLHHRVLEFDEQLVLEDVVTITDRHSTD